MTTTHPAGRRRAGTAADLPPDVAGELALFASEQTTDRNTIRLAYGVAVVLHLVLFAVSLPTSQAEVQPPEPVRVYALEPVRFKEPEILPATPPPTEVRRSIPVPDPDPDGPEMPPQNLEIHTSLPLPDGDLFCCELPDPPPVEEDSGPVEVGNGVLPPEKVFAPFPQYTEAARRARIQGVVVLRTTIDVEGNVVDAEVIKPLAMGLDQAALEAVRQWKFRPATRSSRPVPVYFNLTVTFQLQ